ncbi:hypothetical protein IE53DRAFT_384382 [Violaceomyces palustris]|uniref:Uncharacterized protein n=1 Tax=Violaceomyces palustris TaxID=1673888 RepID=A0ACD0P572_9BASI|nr:hypothetical protein IE53DRAFT_384382 [Violaceomyces palustris]
MNHRAPTPSLHHQSSAYSGTGTFLSARETDVASLGGYASAFEQNDDSYYETDENNEVGDDDDSHDNSHDVQSIQQVRRAGGETSLDPIERDDVAERATIRADDDDEGDDTFGASGERNPSRFRVDPSLDAAAGAGLVVETAEREAGDKTTTCSAAGTDQSSSPSARERLPSPFPIVSIPADAFEKPGGSPQMTGDSRRLDAEDIEGGEGQGELEREREVGQQLEPPTRSKTHAILRHLCILSLLSFSAIWGTLAREGLVALNTYSGQSVAPVIWAQSVGCLIMGWAIGENRKYLESWHPPTYIAITTGFCGSLTTFSTWILEVFRALGDQKHFGRGGLHNVMDALTQTGVTLGMSMASLEAGIALSKVFRISDLYLLLGFDRFFLAGGGGGSRPYRPEASESTAIAVPTPDKDRVMVMTDLCGILLGALFWVATAILCATYPPFRHVTFAILLAPPGAILRWYLSRLNTSKWATSQRGSTLLRWPLGTLAANLSATMFISAIFVGQHVGRSPSASPDAATACYAMYGFQEGFCGCLSTVSTFAVELRNLRPRRRALAYAAFSWSVGILICVLIIGSPWWSIGMDGSCVGVTL